jgi:hypothetical protein
MKFMTSEIFRNEAAGIDGSKLGTIVNIVFDSESLEARMVIFPDRKASSWIMDLIGTAGYLGRDMLYPMTDSFSVSESDVILRGVDEATRRLQDKMIDSESKTKLAYFLLPISEISKIDEDKKTLLEHEAERYGDYLNIPVEVEEVAFYHDELYYDPDRFYGITLNLPTLRGLRIRDPEKKKARVLDMQCDLVEGLVTNVIVQSPGKGVKKRVIPAEEIDFSNMECDNPISTYPPVDE